MMRLRNVFLIAALAGLATGSDAQTESLRPLRAASQCMWTGTIGASVTGVGTETISGSLTLVLDHSDANGQFYKLSTGHIVWTASGSIGNCTVSGVLEFDVSPDSGDSGELYIAQAGGYNGSTGFAKLRNPQKPLVTLTCGGQSSNVLGELAGTLIRDTSATYAGSHISGTYSPQVVPPYHYSWDLALTGAATRLEIRPDDYNNWMPKGGKKEDEIGNMITVWVQLMEQDGSTACGAADSFRFELVNVSHEPGVACNYPNASAAKSDPDMHFSDVSLLHGEFRSPDKLSLKTDGGIQMIVLINSYDWGAYADLKVTAFMPLGKQIEGGLQGQPAVKEVPIPKRSNGSKIADRWKQ